MMCGVTVWYSSGTGLTFVAIGKSSRCVVLRTRITEAVSLTRHGLRLKSRSAGPGDRFDMTMIGPAAAAQHVQIWQVRHQAGVLPAKLLRIPGIELRCLVQLRMAHPRGVGTNAPDSLRPGRPVEQHVFEVSRVRAVNHV